MQITVPRMADIQAVAKRLDGRVVPQAQHDLSREDVVIHTALLLYEGALTREPTTAIADIAKELAIALTLGHNAAPGVAVVLEAPEHAELPIMSRRCGEA